MKFVCDNCGTQYLISDEKVGPKGAKIRCKRCGNIILLRPGEPEPEEEQKETSAPTERMAAPGLDEQEGDQDELGEAFDQLLKGGLDAGEGEEESEEEHQATEIFNMEELHRLRNGQEVDEEQEKIDQVFSQAESTDVVRSQAEAEEDREEWYVAVADEQVGPLVLTDIEKRWETGEIGPETLAWHPGMGDWTAVQEIPKLRYLLGAMTREPAADESPISDQPPQAGEGEEWASSGGSSLASLVEEEMQAAQSSEVAPEEESKPAKAESALEPDMDMDEDEDEDELGEVPPWEREDVVSGEVARPSDSFFDSTLDQSTPGVAADDTGSGRADRELARPAYLTSQTKRKSPAKMIIIVLVILIVLGGGAVAVYLVTQKDKVEPDESSGMTPLDRPESTEKKTDPGKPDRLKAEGVSKKATKAESDKKKATGGQKEMVVSKAGVGKTGDRPAANATSPKKESKDRPRPSKRRKKKKVVVVDRPKYTTPPPPRKKPDKPTEKPKPKATPPGGLPRTLPKAEIAGTMKKYVRAMRGCVKQQQQRDPTVSGTMLVSFTIGRNGKVDLVRILSTEHKGTYVAGCITYIIKSIKFGKFTGTPITVPRVPLRLGG
jgi:predicted Zn finger-like uncharacterized protein